MNLSPVKFGGIYLEQVKACSSTSDSGFVWVKLSNDEDGNDQDKYESIANRGYPGPENLWIGFNDKDSRGSMLTLNYKPATNADIPMVKDLVDRITLPRFVRTQLMGVLENFRPLK